MSKKYEVVIGLEIHVQLDVPTKIFAPESFAFAQDVNVHISPVSLGLPGTLPILNPAVVTSAVRLSLAIGGNLSETFQFDRKHYFYPDLPKGYQITQDHSPISKGGRITIFHDSGPRDITINRFHLEEDAGKLVHDQHDQHSLIDYNRAGAPLIEIVTEPELRSSEEVLSTIAAVQQLVQYLQISKADMEKGQLRCDCNVSVRPRGETKLGPRCEIKNLNSKRFAKQAVEAESRRQIAMLEEGKIIIPQTRRFDPRKQITTPLRSKETALDYRYFPEPDLPAYTLKKHEIRTIEQNMPLLPSQAIQSLQEKFSLAYREAVLFSKSREDVEALHELFPLCPDPGMIHGLYVNKIRPWLLENQKSLDQFPIWTEHLQAFLALIRNKTISQTSAYQKLFPEMLKQTGMHPEALVDSLNLIQRAEDTFLQPLILESFKRHPEKVKLLLAGKTNLVGLFMGEVMRASQGKAHPQETRKRILELAAEFCDDT